MDGFLIIDKPSGITSFDVVARVRRAFLAMAHPPSRDAPSSPALPASGAKKLRVGHLGTLDPLATGVLVVAVGDATKLIEYLMGEDKVYEVQIEFGKISTTYDRDGEVTVIDPEPSVSREALEAALLGFVGAIRQVPPAFSAVKVEGRRAYALARQGKSPNLSPREVAIYSINVRGFEPPFVVLEVHCGSGTYIRSLAHDLGQALGSGGMVTELRRLRVGAFTLDRAAKLAEAGSEALAAEALGYEAHLIPMEKVLEDWPMLALSPEQVRMLASGQPMVCPLGFSVRHDSRPIVGFFDGRLTSLLEPHGRFLKVVKNFIHPSVLPLFL